MVGQKLPEDTMDRIFSETNVVSGDKYKHIIKSLRHKVGDIIEVVKDKKLYLARIDEVKKSEFTFLIVEELEDIENNLEIYLFQANIQKKKMEMVLKLNGMLALNSIVPFISERTENKKLEDIDNERNYAILTDSAEVSKATRLTKIEKTMTTTEAITLANTLDYAIVLYESEETNSLFNFLNEIDCKFPGKLSVGIFVGPEGGFSEEEITFFAERNVKPIRVFKSILRTEMAAFSTISAILAYYERTRYES